MIVPDVNLLIYAYNIDAPHHGAARAWWQELLNGKQPVGLPWATALGFVRLMTHRAVLVEPLSGVVAVTHVQSWLARPNVEPLEPGPRHAELLRQLFEVTGVAGALVTDTHLAALALEHQAELHSNDSDFSRFPGLRWRNPLAQ